ncbi:SCP2 sterol-binding domain-containing protein [Halorientalis litorea]|uniref:SCP2 sterol-binding domain-containing protein n=1 Tax=Halorientalis litorea TaxID=2931977 RepID=UPI001FF4B3A3|nr:SCP2 sterol-binding domain-containing protein [Halorientalis litorea]
MSTQQQTQFELNEYFPTTAWLDRYQDALNEDEEFIEMSTGWASSWNGDFVFEILDLPVANHQVQDLPEELWTAFEDGITQLPEDTLRSIIDQAPEDIQENIEARSGTLHERAVAEMLETEVVEAPEKVWPGLMNVMPDVLKELMDQLEENVTDDANVYAWIGLEDGGCYETDTLLSLDERDKGFILSADYEQWVALVTGELDVVEGIMSGELELKGDMQKILQYSDAAIKMTDVAADLDKRFLF